MSVGRVVWFGRGFSKPWCLWVSTAVIMAVGKHCGYVANGIVKADTLFIRNLYQELSREHRI